MVYAVMGAMAFQNASRRDNAHAFIVNRLAVENLWGEVIVQDQDQFLHQPSPALQCSFRFLTAASRDTFYNDLATQLQGAQGPIVGSWIAKHDCTHDQQSNVPCVESGRLTF